MSRKRGRREDKEEQEGKEGRKVGHEKGKIKKGKENGKR